MRELPARRGAPFSLELLVHADHLPALLSRSPCDTLCSASREPISINNSRDAPHYVVIKRSSLSSPGWPAEGDLVWREQAMVGRMRREVSL